MGIFKRLRVLAVRYMGAISRKHPRYHSLMTREKIVRGMKNGIVHDTGLIAHGRGEAFDYLLGEQTVPPALEAAKIAAAALLCAHNPVISLNGNVTALVPKNCVRLEKSIPAKLEINLFHRSSERIKNIRNELLQHGAEQVFGEKGDATIPGLDHDRAICDSDGIYSADVVLVPLEDGDRCKALVDMGKTVIVIDLNPLSRTARTATITIVDNVIRAIPHIQRYVSEFSNQDRTALNNIASSWNNAEKLTDILAYISKRLNSLAL